MPVGAPFPEQNMTEVWDLFNYTNAVTSPSANYHYFGDFMVILVWIVLFSAFVHGFSVNRSIRAMMVSSLITFVWAVLLDMVNLIDSIFVNLPLVMLSVTIVVDKLSSRD